jgi:glycosyltransferase involved in cell wall biosynthesis
MPRPALPPFRIGIDARKLGDYGIGEYLWNLILHLHRLAPEHHYVLLHQSPPPGALPRPAEWVWDGSGKYSLREQISLPWHAWRRGMHLLHCPHYVVPVAMPVLRPCPLVVTIHDLIHLKFGQYWSLPARQYARFMLGRAVAGAAHILADSEGAKRDIVERLGARPERVTVAYLGTGEAFRPVADPAALAGVRARYGLDGPFVLFVGNARMRHKNVVTLARALRLLPGRGTGAVTLAITGGELPPDVRAQLTDAAGPAAPRLRFTGFVEEAHLPALYSAAAAFVWPSLYEGFGIPPVQAMACGTPVVSSNSSVMPEILGAAALFVPPLEPEAWAEAIARVLEDSALRARMAAQGRAQAARYSWDETARKTLQVYEAVLKG